METSIFDFDLPDNLIALQPSIKRDDCRLLVLNKENGTIEHRIFKDIIDYLNKGDVLVLNNSKVLNACLYGKRKSGAKIEILLLETENFISWNALTNRTKRLKIEEEIELKDGYTATIKEVFPGGKKRILFNKPLTAETLEDIGEVPLPPYIKKKRNHQGKDKEWYQNVFALNYGSMACPTAGLHFTEELLKEIKSKGVKVAYVTLHVSLSTFNPIRKENIDQHEMHKEYYKINRDTADIINLAKKENNKIFAVGTTVVRTLEEANRDGELKECEGFTNIYLKPGHRFKSCDAIITNFHTPRSTLLVLVSAFASVDFIKSAYYAAIKEKYRFFSYGDAMLIY